MASRRKNAAVVVAHPDDETLWAGGTILRGRDFSWTVVTVCRGGDPDRAPRFYRAMERLGAAGAMADLDDGPEQKLLDVGLIEGTVSSLLPRKNYDLLMTHSPFGEYTRHRRHEETGRTVAGLWEKARLAASELWLFAYEDGGKQYYPRPIGRAHLHTTLEEDVWEQKSDIIRNTYGFQPDSWETRSTPRTEAFWCFNDVRAYRNWLKKEEDFLGGNAK